LQSVKNTDLQFSSHLSLQHDCTNELWK